MVLIAGSLYNCSESLLSNYFSPLFTITKSWMEGQNLVEQLHLHYCRCGPKSPLMDFEGRINNDVYVCYCKRTSYMPLAFSHTTVRFWPLILEFSGQASVGDLQRII